VTLLLLTVVARRGKVREPPAADDDAQPTVAAARLFTGEAAGNEVAFDDPLLTNSVALSLQWQPSD
jgi:hypothetical protein